MRLFFISSSITFSHLISYFVCYSSFFISTLCRSRVSVNLSLLMINFARFLENISFAGKLQFTLSLEVLLDDTLFNLIDFTVVSSFYLLVSTIFFFLRGNDKNHVILPFLLCSSFSLFFFGNDTLFIFCDLYYALELIRN